MVLKYGPRRILVDLSDPFEVRADDRGLARKTACSAGNGSPYGVAGWHS